MSVFNRKKDHHSFVSTADKYETNTTVEEYHTFHPNMPDDVRAPLKNALELQRQQMIDRGIDPDNTAQVHEVYGDSVLTEATINNHFEYVTCISDMKKYHTDPDWAHYASFLHFGSKNKNAWKIFRQTATRFPNRRVTNYSCMNPIYAFVLFLYVLVFKVAGLDTSICVYLLSLLYFVIGCCMVEW